MLAMLLAAALSSAPAAHVEDAILTAIFATQGARSERETISKWLEEQDATRARELGRRPNPFEDDPKPSPFPDATAKPDPFDGPPRLFWWSTTETTRRPKP